MKLFAGILAVVFLMTSPAVASWKWDRQTSTLDPQQILFAYQSNVEPWDRVDCKHERASVGVHEWDVYCKVGLKMHRYGVHLVLSYYPKTIHGGSSYEVLYWVTDWTGVQPVSDSTTIWIHQKDLDARAVVIEAAQGVENDLSSLSLTVKTE